MRQICVVILKTFDFLELLCFERNASILSSEAKPSIGLDSAAQLTLFNSGDYRGLLLTHLLFSWDDISVPSFHISLAARVYPLRIAEERYRHWLICAFILLVCVWCLDDISKRARTEIFTEFHLTKTVIVSERDLDIVHLTILSSTATTILAKIQWFWFRRSKMMHFQRENKTSGKSMGNLKIKTKKFGLILNMHDRYKIIFIRGEYLFVCTALVQRNSDRFNWDQKKCKMFCHFYDNFN